MSIWGEREAARVRVVDEHLLLLLLMVTDALLSALILFSRFSRGRGDDEVTVELIKDNDFDLGNGMGRGNMMR